MTRTLTIAGRARSGIKIASPEESRTAFKLLAGEREAGLLLRNRKAEPWDIGGLDQGDDGLYLYGAPLDMSPLADSLGGGPGAEREALKVCAELAEAFALLGEQSAGPSRLWPGGIFRLGGGGFLFLPDSVMEKILSLTPEEKRIPAFSGVNHPGLPYPERISFSLACLAYRILTGREPYPFETEDEIRERMRAGSVIPPLHIRPEIRPEISGEILAVLKPRKNNPPPAIGPREISRWLEEGLFREITEPEKESLKAGGEKEWLRQEAKKRKKDFLRRNKIRIIVAAAVLAALGILGGHILSNALRPRLTAGLPAAGVARLFYESIGKMDHQAMRDCVTGKAGAAKIDEAARLFVISRLRQGVEMSAVFVDAADWDAAGRPALPEGKILYGIAGLLIKDETENPEEPRFTVSFEKWIPGPEGGRPFLGFAVEERLRMRRDKGDWLISEIEKIRESEIQPKGVPD
jgi:hypothetical protein